MAFLKSLALPLFVLASSSLARPTTPDQDAVGAYSQIFTSIGSVPDIVPYFYGTPLRATYPTLDAPLQPGQALSIAGMSIGTRRASVVDDSYRGVIATHFLGFAGPGPEHEDPLCSDHAGP